ncbi:MAG: flagellar motor protein MotD [Gammaproteobacteria bacterium]|nr:MAG: flagellar motor protein MotD [Gammaproteobacteria bacterium]
MSRRRRHEEHANHEAWAIPYGDLVTLLLAFFVVMYALSSVNEGKYRILSDSLVAAFRASPKSLEPIQVGELSLAQHEIDLRQQRVLVPIEIDSLPDLLDRDLEIRRSSALSAADAAAAADMIDEITDALEEALAELMSEDMVRLRRDQFWVEIEINTSLLFPSASAELTREAADVVYRVGSILAGKDTRVQVEGHTDVLPIRTERFPSNWELSTARASTVVRMFATAGVDPAQLAAVGYGEYRPVADNNTPAGQAENRRVVIVVMANPAREAGATLAATGGGERS